MYRLGRVGCHKDVTGGRQRIVIGQSLGQTKRELMLTLAVGVVDQCRRPTTTESRMLAHLTHQQTPFESRLQQVHQSAVDSPGACLKRCLHPHTAYSGHVHRPVMLASIQPAPGSPVRAMAAQQQAGDGQHFTRSQTRLHYKAAGVLPFAFLHGVPVVLLGAEAVKTGPKGKITKTMCKQPVLSMYV